MFYIHSNKVIEVIKALNALGANVLNSRFDGWTGEQLLTSATPEQMEIVTQQFGGQILNHAAYI